MYCCDTIGNSSCGRNNLRFYQRFCIAKLNVHLFIATLAMMNAARGLAYAIFTDKPVFGLPDSFGWGGTSQHRSYSRINCINGYCNWAPPIWCSLKHASAVIFMQWEAIRRFPKLTGINVTMTRFSVYVISGILAALAGSSWPPSLNGQATAATGYELNTAAVAMGGTSMSGGRGGIPQTVVGLFVIGIINNALSLLGVSSYWQTVAMGYHPGCCHY